LTRPGLVNRFFPPKGAAELEAHELAKFQAARRKNCQGYEATHRGFEFGYEVCRFHILFISEYIDFQQIVKGLLSYVERPGGTG
jgi:hypothetical protein